MESLNKGSSIPKDLRVTVLSSSTLHPSEPTERRSMFLSNIDQVLNFSFETVHFFPANPDYPVDIVAESLRSAVERLLVPYDFLAGRLRFDPGECRLEIDCNDAGVGDPGECRLEIDCNDAGVGFVVATSELELAELGELEYPNPAFRQFVLAEPTDGMKLEDHPLIAFQVTSFRCGGFALGVSINHAAFDGISLQIFLKNLASLVAGQPLPITPYTNRRLLTARSPPHVTFPHPELMQLDALLAYPPSTMLDLSADKIELQLFRLSTDNISTLKEKARAGGCTATSFNALTAHLWRCKALAAITVDPDKLSTVLFAVDIRPRLHPPLPPAYTGNAVLSAYAAATFRELEDGPFARLVEAVAGGVARLDDDYSRSVIDWGQVHKGIPHGDMFVTSWLRLGFAEVEYPWGRPACSCPVPHPQRDIVLLFPDIGGASKGVNALVSLPAHDMKRFEDLFYKFLA